jgi:hypothetical protein
MSPEFPLPEFQDKIPLVKREENLKWHLIKKAKLLSAGWSIKDADLRIRKILSAQEFQCRWSVIKRRGFCDCLSPGKKDRVLMAVMFIASGNLIISFRRNSFP